MKLRKTLNKKGFTLMEIIVVLIIIAVLAAALIPSFVGFIRDSRSATAINEARIGMNAAQVLLTEEHGKNEPADPFPGGVVTGAASITRFNTLLGADVPAGVNNTNFSGIVIVDPVDGVGTRVGGIFYDGNPAFDVLIDSTDGRAVAGPKGSFDP